MQKDIKCPLCVTKQDKEIEIIESANIVNLWNKQGICISYLFENNQTINKYLCKECGLEFFYPYISGDNKFYSKLGEDEWYYLHGDKTEFNYSNNFIKNGDSVLDIGSGRGAFLKYIDKDISYTGLELSSKAVEFASKENIYVIEQTIEEHSINNQNKYDVVVTFQVLEHITNIDSFITSALSVVKQNGLFIIAVPNNNSFIRNSQNNLLNLPPHHLLHWNEMSLRYIAKKFNLEVVDIYKEKVTNVHKTWFYLIQISKFIRVISGMSTESVNTSFSNKIIQKISSILSRVAKYSFLHTKKDGHTVAVVLKKASDV